MGLLIEEVENKKRPLEIEDINDHKKKSSRQCVLGPVSSQTGHNSDDLDSLIYRIGRDISISCLIHCSRADYGSVASLNSRFCSVIRNKDLYRLRRKHGVIEHWVYISCYSLRWDVFDPNRRKWMQLPLMYSELKFPPLVCTKSLAVGTELLVFGLEDGSNVVYKYSVVKNSWSSEIRLNDPRCCFASASLGDVAIIAGGCDSKSKALASAELYNSENGTWERLPNMHKPRTKCCGVVMDNKLYVIGGFGGRDSMELLTCGEEFDLEKKIWTEIPNMSPVRTSEHLKSKPLVAVVNDELYSADYRLMELGKYDKENKVWVTIGTLPKGVASMWNNSGWVFTACGDRIIICVGSKDNNESFVEVHSWVPYESPNVPKWTLLSRKRSDRVIYNYSVMGC